MRAETVCQASASRLKQGVADQYSAEDIAKLHVTEPVGLGNGRSGDG